MELWTPGTNDCNSSDIDYKHYSFWRTVTFVYAILLRVSRKWNPIESIFALPVRCASENLNRWLRSTGGKECGSLISFVWFDFFDKLITPLINQSTGTLVSRATPREWDWRVMSARWFTSVNVRPICKPSFQLVADPWPREHQHMAVSSCMVHRDIVEIRVIGVWGILNICDRRKRDTGKQNT